MPGGGGGEPRALVGRVQSSESELVTACPGRPVSGEHMTEWNPHCPACGRKLRLEEGQQTPAAPEPEHWRCGAGHVWRRVRGDV